MIGDIAATVDVIEGGTDSLQLLLSQQHIIFLSATPQGINVRMFTKNDAILVLFPSLLQNTE